MQSAMLLDKTPKAFDVAEQTLGKSQVLRGNVTLNGASIAKEALANVSSIFPTPANGSKRFATVAAEAAQTVANIPNRHLQRLDSGTVGSVTREELSDLREVLHEMEALYGEF
ncbi:hypothetical protein HDU97_010332 [Phlyctochytrium planicorne]|nr:hypothetical protein HDU97_010332 [Phlyctochytrium planicorne]